MNWSVKGYCVGVKSNRKTIYWARVIEEIVTLNRSWCNRHQLSPCSNRDYEMWSIRYSRYTSNRDSTSSKALEAPVYLTSKWRRFVERFLGIKSLILLVSHKALSSVQYEHWSRSSWQTLLQCTKNIEKPK